MIDTPQTPVATLAAAWAPMRTALGVSLPVPLNDGPQHHYVAEAAPANLDAWVATGKAASAAPPIALTYVTAAGGTAVGLRTPWVDVLPVTRLTGFPATVMGPGALGGAAMPYAPAALAQSYPGGKADYLRKFQAALDKAIQAGFILTADRKEILELARLGYPAASP